MNYPDDVLKAAREAAAKYWESIDAKEFADDCREGKDDEANEVQAACIAIMAERERCASMCICTAAGNVTRNNAPDAEPEQTGADAAQLGDAL